MRLLSSQGELVRGRCGATNLCDYCARLAAVENAELLALDALAGIAPRVWAVLTTRTATTQTRRFYKSREAVFRALRRRWPDCEMASIVEFTTGYGDRSGGKRRPHWNLLIKGVPPDELDELHRAIVQTWCAREDAKPAGQFVGQIGEFGGLMRYLALHFQKASQQPPPGWTGHRLLKTRGYLQGSTAEAREAAKRSLRFKRELYRAEGRLGPGEAAEAAAERAMALADATGWRLIDWNPPPLPLALGPAPPVPVVRGGPADPAPCLGGQGPTGPRAP